MWLMPSADTKGNSESDFNHHEESFDHKASEEHTMLRAVQDTDAEVLDADENSADQVCHTSLSA
jgi:hypothetical protein